jgi:hypothetical protein
VTAPDLSERWLRSFAFTLVVEVPVFMLVARRHIRGPRAAAAGAVGSCLTHPLLWFVWPGVIRALLGATGGLHPGVPAYLVYLVSGELLVALIESATFWGAARALGRPVPWALAVAASFLANAASFGGGQLVRALTGLL